MAGNENPEAGAVIVNEDGTVRQPGDVAPNEPVVESTEPSEPTPGEGEPAEKPEEVNLEPVVDEDTESKVKKLEKRVGYLQRRLERQAKRQGAPKLPDPIDDGTKPKADDYETIEDYQTAVQNWTIDKRVNEGVRKALATDPTEDVAADREEFKTALLEQGPRQFSDFNETVLNRTLPLTIGMLDYAREMDNEKVSAADMVYYLGKHPDVTTSLSRMNPTQFAREMAKIELKLEALPRAKAGAQPGAKTVSSAPEPITPTDSAVIVTKNPDEMSQAEYEKWRASGGGT